MSVVFDRPYEFVPRDRSIAWPWLIHRLRLVDRYLRKKEGVVANELIHFDRLRQSVDMGHSVIAAPNHCRYADPLTMGWPSRATNIYFYAVASWHLYNKGWFEVFGMRRCGAFSLHREGSDRKSLETAIEILANAERPLIIFPEGQTFRTNDLIRPLLEGVGFIARSAARKRQKQNGGQVVVHPIAIKYLTTENIDRWANEQLEVMESHLGWRRHVKPGLLSRVLRLSDAQLVLNEIAFLGSERTGDLADRRSSLSDHLLQNAEEQLGISSTDSQSVDVRIRTIRSSIVAAFFQPSVDTNRQRQLKDLDGACEVAHELSSYNDHEYLNTADVTDERLVETIQRIQESLVGKINRKIPLKVFIDCGEAIPVPAAKAPKGQSDPLLASIAQQLGTMIDQYPGRKRSQH